MERRVKDNPAFATFPLNDPGAQEIKYSEGLFVGYRGYENRIKPQYPFGYGLSYTKFRYSDLEVEPMVLKKNIGLGEFAGAGSKTRERFGSDSRRRGPRGKRARSTGSYSQKRKWKRRSFRPAAVTGHPHLANWGCRVIEKAVPHRGRLG